MNVQIVLIHDQPVLRHLLADFLRGWIKHHVEVEEAGYDVRLAGVWQRWLEEADLFILGLERRYEHGLRAEGVTVAGQVARSGKRALIVGGECSGSDLAREVYWDMGSPSTFLQSVDSCLNCMPPSDRQIEQLHRYFGSRLEIPTGH